MKYNYRAGVTLDKKKPTWLLWIVATVVLAVGAYYAANYLAPRLISMPLSDKASADATMRQMQATTPADEGTHLYLPQLNVDVAVTREQSGLERGASWQRNEASPQDQDVLVVCAQRFSIGATPWESRDRSPFYNLDKLEPGDEVYIDYNAERYAYRVSQKKPANTGAEVANTADKPMLNLHICSADGQPDSSVAVVAEQVGKVAVKDKN